MFSANAKLPTNKLIVKPIPVKIETPYRLNQLALSGICAAPNLTATKENIMTPTCLPINNPRRIPSGTGCNNDVSDKPCNETPALANANKGIIIKATYGLMACSSLINNEKSLFLDLWGMVEAKRTPAIVACIPDLYVKNHMNAAIIK